MTSSPEETGRIRRVRGRRLDATVIVGLVLVVIVAVALLLTRPTHWSVPVAAPSEQALVDTVRVCPTAIGGHDEIAAGSDAAGTLAVTPHVHGLRGALAAGQLRTGSGGGSSPVVLTASGAAAGSFAATRWSTAPLSASDCAGPVADEWFTGLGAGAVHDSTVTITNPTDGEAVVDLDLYGAKGPVDVPVLRGIALEAGSTKTFDLLQTTPMSGPLAAHVVVTRGQAAVSAVDATQSLTGGKPVQEWVQPQRHASRQAVLLGIDPTHGTHTLYVANPTGRQLTADLKLVTTSSVFIPNGAPSLKLPPQSVVSISLDKLLASKVADGTLGIQIDATGIVTASLRRTTAGDILAATAGDPVAQPAGVLVPPGAKQLVLLGDTGVGDSAVGAVTVISSDANGHQLDSQRISVTADEAASVDLPAGAVSVEVTPENVSIIGTVVVTSGGTATQVPLHEQTRRNLVPAVRPALR